MSLFKIVNIVIAETTHPCSIMITRVVRFQIFKKTFNMLIKHFDGYKFKILPLRTLINIITCLGTDKTDTHDCLQLRISSLSSIGNF